MVTENFNEQKITKDEIQHIANLARIDITEEEKEKYALEMSAILGYIEQLKEVDTKNIKPTAQVTGLANITREDQLNMADMDERGKILESVPAKEGDYIKVKSVL